MDDGRNFSIEEAVKRRGGGGREIEEQEKSKRGEGGETEGRGDEIKASVTPTAT